jgi:hypothetical protein
LYGTDLSGEGRIEVAFLVFGDIEELGEVAPGQLPDSVEHFSISGIHAARWIIRAMLRRLHPRP